MSATACASDFTTFQHDNYHSGVTTDSAPITNASLLNWSSPTGGSGMSGLDVAPIVADGKVFEVNYNGTVFAFNKTNGGNPLWVTKTITGGSFELSTPAYYNNTLYVGVYNSTRTGIFAINATNGNIKWSDLSLTAQQINTPIVYDPASNMLFFGTWIGTVNSTYQGIYYGYYDNGTYDTRAWLNGSSNGGYYWAGAAVIGNYLVYGNDNSMVVSVNKNDGTWVDSINASTFYNVTAQQIRSSIAYNPTTNRIYFTSRGVYCYALGFYPNGTFNRSDKWCTSIGYSTSTPAVYGGNVFVGVGGMYGGTGLKILNESNGSIMVNVSTNGPVQASPVISVNQSTGNYYAYFTTNVANGMVYCIDKNGNLMWTYLPPSGKQQFILQGVAISDGYVYFGNDAGYLFGLHQ